MNRFIEFYGKQTEKITKNRLDEERSDLRHVKGIYDDIEGFGDNVQIIKKVIMGDVMNEVVLPNEQIRKIDLEKIMKNGRTKSKAKKGEQESADDGSDEDYEDDDGNKWDEN
jgi:uncharacterized protein (UPF0335 family)